MKTFESGVSGIPGLSGISGWWRRSSKKRRPFIFPIIHIPLSGKNFPFPEPHRSHGFPLETHLPAIRNPNSAIRKALILQNQKKKGATS